MPAGAFGAVRPVGAILPTATAAGRRDAATFDFWRRRFSMSYIMQRGNATKKSLHFHAISKMISDYQ